MKRTCSSQSLANTADNDDTDDAITVVKRLSAATGILTTTDKRQLAKCGEIAKDVVRSQVKLLISNNQGAPIARSSSCDGTPIATKKQLDSSKAI